MEDKYFKQALSDFTIEFASGDAIRSLSDKGYSVKKIKSKLDFPTPEERIREIVWKHYIDNKTICLENPKEALSVENYTIKKVYDSYGRPSFKKVSVKADKEVLGSKQAGVEADEEVPSFQQAGVKADEEAPSFKHVCVKADGEALGLKQGDVKADEVSKWYVECDFGKRLYQNKEEFLKSLSVLDEEEKDYILGLPWPLTKVWHVKNEKFAKIITKLSGEKSNGK